MAQSLPENAVKIPVDKSEDVLSILERVMRLRRDTVVLVVPRHSKLASSPNNLHLLKRETEAAGIRVALETVDDALISLATSKKILAVNPFFGGIKSRAMDITRKGGTMVRQGHFSPFEETHRDIVRVSSADLNKDREASNTVEIPRLKKARSFRIAPPRWKKKIIVSIVACIVIVMSGALYGIITKKADITLVRALKNWESKADIFVESKVSLIDLEAKRIPGILIKERKNMNFEFPASRSEYREVKAQATLSVSNEAGVAAQVLLQGTRFLSPDGKIFRSVERVVVPGVVQKNGISIAGTRLVRVAAEEAGVEYNVASSTGWRLPGFEGSPKYETVTASLLKPANGGLKGKFARPTEADIAQAKKASEELLRQALEAFVVTKLSGDFVRVPEANRLYVFERIVYPEIGSEGKFTVFIDGELTEVAFQDKDARTFFEEVMKKNQGEEYEFVDGDVVVNHKSASLKNDTLTFSAEYKGRIAKRIDTNSLRSIIADKNERELENIMKSIPGLASVKISLWPFWMTSTPGIDRITIEAVNGLDEK